MARPDRRAAHCYVAKASADFVRQILAKVGAQVWRSTVIDAEPTALLDERHILLDKTAGVGGLGS
ncbi:hypothetical protein LQ954_04370 [Sphingomonas sp. IC-11]|uniref:hypothetical protein n=1 Tax=Sphingomonas sp. IC-11 TaxID=2898528 RepID=UPI001E2F25AA|nr:hypothetical protein [Sphingomonas sp. IC-11]MCD2315381.1 hypothetical protein [Sphingomonas sp. IC-11]